MIIETFLIGIAFGFFLESSGLGNAKKLVGQFYFTDMTVFKVMFSAIITASFGLMLFDFLNLIDLYAINFTPTYIYPFILGGIIFGIGFVSAGLCPGTSIVAASTGKLDGIFVLIGIFIGIISFGGIFDHISSFYYSSPMYSISIPSFFGLNISTVVLIVTSAALLLFSVATKIEKIFNPGNYDFQDRRQINFRLGLLILSASFLFNAFHIYENNAHDFSSQLAESKSISLIEPLEVAEKIIRREKDFMILDIRDSVDYEDYHIPGSISKSSIYSDKAVGKKKIIVVSKFLKYEDGALKKIMDIFHEEDLMIISGGIEKWYEDILFPDLRIPDGSSAEINIKRQKISRYFGGDPQIKEGSDPKGGKYIREGCG